MILLAIRKATVEFGSASVALQLVDLAQQWRMEVWTLDDSDSMIPDVFPGTVPIVFHSGGDTHIWPTRRTKASSKKKASSSSAEAPPLPPPGIGPPALAAGDADDSESDEGAAEEGEEPMEERVTGTELSGLLNAMADELEGEQERAETAAFIGGACPSPPACSASAKSSAAGPSAPPPAIGREYLGRSKPHLRVEVPGGSLTWYRSGYIEAQCGNKKHVGKRCVLTRKAGAPSGTAKGGPGSGRPVGFLAAWLARGCECGSRERHWADDNMVIPWAERMLARMYVLDLPIGVDLSDKERPANDAYDQDGEPLADVQ